MNSTIMHACNVWWPGGVCSFIQDIAETMPGFRHVACHCVQAAPDAEKENLAKASGVEVYQLEHGLTEELLQSLKPFVTIMHNLSPRAFRGRDTGWIHKYPIINWCHGARIVHDTKGVFNIFVSEFTRHLNVSRKHVGYGPVVPPCIDTDPLTTIHREPVADKVRFGNAISPWSKNKYKPEQVEQIRAFAEANSDMCEFIELDRILPNLHKYLAQIDCLVSFTSCLCSWERVITEAFAAGIPVITNNAGGPQEQVRSAGEWSGILIDRADEIPVAMSRIIEHRDKYVPNAAGREYAVNFASRHALRNKLLPIITHVGLRTIENLNT